MIVTIHGRQFEIEVSDWEKPEDANRLVDIVHSWLQGLSSYDVVRLHTEMAAYQAEGAGGESKMTGRVLEAFQTCEAATTSLFDEWGFVPEAGHQCYLHAR